MSIKILAINTATELCSVALITNNIIVKRSLIVSREHAQQVLPMIDNVLTKANIELKNLDVLAFSQGPGNFVGIRIGIGIVQSLALAIGLPVIGVSTLATLAQGAWRKFGVRKVLTAIYARSEEMYFSFYKLKNNIKWLGENFEQVFSIKELRRFLDQLDVKITCVGNGWKMEPEFLHSNISSIYLNKLLYPAACDMLPLVLQKWQDGLVLSPGEARPVYLRNKLFNQNC